VPSAEVALTAARLRVAVSRLARRLRPTRAAGPLTTTEVDMLIVAERHGPARISEFASFCGLNPTMVSRMVPKLEEAGLLLRRPDPDDKRASKVEASSKGRKLLEEVRSERDDVLAKVLADLDDEERRAISGAVPALERVAERLATQGRPAPPHPAPGVAALAGPAKGRRG
jgi:DNA-binding MarR family transcriptional regulator